MSTASYIARRGELETYFDRTAVEAWARLTSDAPVSGIRATVRAGRDRMRALLLSWLPQDMRGLHLLDAGCGTGALAVEAARRGAKVTATDLSATLVNLARERTPRDLGDGSIEFLVGDMTEAGAGRFDYAVAHGLRHPLPRPRSRARHRDTLCTHGARRALHGSPPHHASHHHARRRPLRSARRPRTCH